MNQSEFRCAFVARDYKASVAFYRDDLKLNKVGGWDRGHDDRGTLFAAAAGIIEVMALPKNQAYTSSPQLGKKDDKKGHHRSS